MLVMSGRRHPQRLKPFDSGLQIGNLALDERHSVTGLLRYQHRLHRLRDGPGQIHSGMICPL
jgi:hypothetical protein